MKTLQEQAKQWRDAFGVERDSGKDSSQFNLQAKLIVEEYGEVIEALYKFEQTNKNTHCDLLKELADLVFVCYQAAENMEWNLDEAMRRVFESNMSKLDDTGIPVRNEHGKVLKGPNYLPPDLSDLV